jgi:3-hydroxyacyl-CoA dehydrogenase
MHSDVLSDFTSPPGFGSTVVSLEARGAVLILWINAPPVNALGHALRQGLAEGIALGNQSPQVRAMVILARGRTFPAGADISEIGKTPQAPLLPDLCNLIEGGAKPVVAGLHGTALGGGLELALAAHGRVAQAQARLGLPEVGLGILPGAGGTQRLPRLIGADAALQMMISGTPVSAAQALGLGLLDRVVDHDLTGAAVTMALHLAGAAPKPTRARTDGFGDAKAFFASVAAARRAQATSPLPGPARIVDCVEAAMLLPFEQGLAFERSAFTELVDSPQAEALRHAFFAQRRMGRMPGAKAKPLDLRQIAVLGAGPDSVELIRALLTAGHDVVLVDRSTDALTGGLEAVAEGLAADVAAGRIDGAAQASQWARLVPALPGGEEDAADMLFVTGAFARPGATAVPVAVKAGAPIITLGRRGDGGARGLGLILMPATREGLLAEILVAPETQPEAVATVLALLKPMGRSVLQGQGAGVCAGLAHALTAGLGTVEALHGPEAVAQLKASWGIMPPQGDAEGNAGDRMGDYTGGGPADLWSGAAAPVMGALANAGLHMLGDARALRPSDIDMAFILGFGFARWGGGPMLWAARRGLMVLRDDLNRWAKDDPDLWTPAPLLDDLIRQDISLEDLNDA